MVMTAIFDEENERDLSDVLNEFLSRMDDNALIDIKYACSHFVTQTGEQIYSYTAMVIYKFMVK